ncbi:MAG TPA: ribosome biogenesis GTP-binding protein YihA/YsxC [Lachnospiraceae bacterium]|nr:ribosome biogenesis GTP-binding protein YihA/YsxC [Lachnospiraceae bacterium]
MKIKNVELETVCGITSKLPDNQLVEVAFAGKSNVGKSSLINALMNRKSLARTSAQPGKTQTINFYHITGLVPEQDESTDSVNNVAKKEKEIQLYFVDLPGYGYAKASISAKEQWGKMIERYLHSSKQLKAVFLLIDIRHEPSANDRNMYDWILHNGYKPIIIATKLDKINRSQIAKQVKLIKTTLKAEPETIIIPFSATSKQGRDEIYDTIGKIL